MCHAGEYRTASLPFLHCFAAVMVVVGGGGGGGGGGLVQRVTIETERASAKHRALS